MAAKIFRTGCVPPHSCVNLCLFVRPAQESYACDVEGVDADFLLLMAGLVKSGVCSKARCGIGVGTHRTWYNLFFRLLYVEDYQDKGAADVVGTSDLHGLSPHNGPAWKGGVPISIGKFTKTRSSHDPNLTLNKNLKFKFKILTVFL